MPDLTLKLLGELAVIQAGEEIKLPASRKTRALLAYLVQTGRPQRRERLCDVFWDVPDDPRGALRWSLSKLRPIVNTGDVQHLKADRERVWFVPDGVQSDIGQIISILDSQTASLERLLGADDQLSDPFLDGLDMPSQELFESWLTAEREELRRVRGRVSAQIAKHPESSADQSLKYHRNWLELDPFNPDAASGLVTKLEQLGHADEAATLTAELSARFKRAGIQWSYKQSQGETVGNTATNKKTVTQRELLQRQRIGFCSASDGAKIAYARLGDGPPLVKAANWLNHLELDWDAPIWSPLFRELAKEHTFIRYDERGNGLSDWEVSDLSFESFVTDLETVVDAANLERFPLLGISQGASVSIEYAIRHPEKVSHLILFGAYAAGWRIDASEELIKEREAIMTLTASGWGRANPAYRQIFSSTFMPTATAEELHWFDDFQRATASPDNAVRFLSAFGDIDVRHRLEELDVPTLVLHSRGDQRIPFETGRDIAAQIPGAEFVGLDSDNHLLLGREPASGEFVDAVRRFLDQ
ncbi:MAG: alpha/beta fold hydrolase [Gammaproteobacteria bacterium]